MIQGWSSTDAKGRPLAAGRLAYFIDSEDGTGPMFTYGSSTEEILEKIGKTAGTAQSKLQQERAARSTQPGTVAKPAPSQNPVPAGRKPLTADEQMNAVRDLGNPAKAPGAIVSLIESETGLDVEALTRQNFANVAVAWRRRNPDFVDHPANMRLLTEQAIRAANGLGRVTEAHLDAVYNRLTAEGSLILADELVATPPPTPNPISREEGIPTPGTRQPGESYATTYRRGALHALPSPGSVQPRLKYTRRQIETMPYEEMARVIDDPDYIKAFDWYQSHPNQATA